MSTTPYQMEPFSDFKSETTQTLYKQGLDTVKSYLGQTYGLVINGQRVYSEKKMNSLNPSNHSEVVGTIHQASVKDAEQAIQAALTRFESWKHVDPFVRSDVLFKTAAIIRRRKFEFSALLTIEAGKPWPEADADVAEAIDFLEYYGRQMRALTRIDDVILSQIGRAHV